MNRKNPLFTFVILFFLFATPLFLAWYMVYGGYVPSARINRGTLFSPALALQNLPWRNIDGSPFLWKNTAQQWAMVYVLPQSCDDECRKTLYTLHQVRIALNQDQDRFIRVLVFLTPHAVNQVKEDEYAKGMVFLTLDKEALFSAMKRYPYKNKLIEQGGVLIFDSEQRAVLGYPANLNPEDLLKDLQRLMRAFHLGNNKT